MRWPNRWAKPSVVVLNATQQPKGGKNKEIRKRHKCVRPPARRRHQTGPSASSWRKRGCRRHSFAFSSSRGKQGLSAPSRAHRRSPGVKWGPAGSTRRCGRSAAVKPSRGPNRASIAVTNKSLIVARPFTMRTIKIDVFVFSLPSLKRNKIRVSLANRWQHLIVPMLSSCQTFLSHLAPFLVQDETGPHQRTPSFKCSSNFFFFFNIQLFIYYAQIHFSTNIWSGLKQLQSKLWGSIKISRWLSMQSGGGGDGESEHETQNNPADKF